MKPIEMIVRRAGQGKFYASVSGLELLKKASFTPFFSECRRLVEFGYDPKLLVVMKHEGSNNVAMSSTIGAAAARTITEDGQGTPRIAKYTVPVEGIAARAPSE